MTQKIVYTCDLCASPDDVGDKRRISVFVDRAMDAAGSMEDEYDSFDLCHACAVRVLKQMVTKRTCVPGVTIDGPALSKWLKNQRK